MSKEGSEVWDDVAGTTGAEGSTGGLSPTAPGSEQIYPAGDQPSTSGGSGDEIRDSETRSTVSRDERAEKTLSKFSDDSSGDEGEESQIDDSTMLQSRDEEPEERGSEIDTTRSQDEAPITIQHDQHSTPPTAQTPSKDLYNLHGYLQPTARQIENEQKAAKEKSKVDRPQATTPTSTVEDENEPQLPYGGEGDEIFRRDRFGRHFNYTKGSSAPRSRNEDLGDVRLSSLRDAVSADKPPKEEDSIENVFKDFDRAFGDEQEDEEWWEDDAPIAQQESEDITSNGGQGSESANLWDKLNEMDLGDPFAENSEENMDEAMGRTSSRGDSASDDDEQMPIVSTVSNVPGVVFFDRMTPDSAAMNTPEYSRPLTPLNLGKSSPSPPSGDSGPGITIVQDDSAESSHTDPGTTSDEAVHESGSKQQPQQTGSLTDDANEEEQDPPTPDSAKELEFMSGIPITEGSMKGEELENQIAQVKTQRVNQDPAFVHIKTPHPNSARDLELQRQVLKERESSDRYVNNIQIGDGIEQYKAQSEYAFARAHSYRYQRDQWYQKYNTLSNDYRWAREETESQYNKRLDAEKHLKTAKDERDLWETSFNKNREKAMIEVKRRERRERGEDGMVNGSMQTDDVEIRTLTSETSTTQTPRPPIIQTADRAMQTDTNSAAVAQRPAHIVRRHSIPSQPIQWPAIIRPQLVEHLVESINDSHQQLRGPEICAITEGRLETLLGSGETTFEQLVSALNHEGFTFRPDHLAQEIERFIRPHGRVPAGILVAARGFSNIEEGFTRLLEELAETQFELGMSEADRRRAGYQAPGPSNGQTVEEYEKQQGELAAMAMQLDEYQERCQNLEHEENECKEHRRVHQADIAELEEANEDLVNEGAKLFDENVLLKTAIEELESTVKELTERETPSPLEDSPKADREEFDALRVQLGECRSHKESIEAKLSQLNDEKTELKRMHKELEATNRDLGLQVQDLSKKLADCEEANWQLVQKQPTPPLDADVPSDQEVPDEKKSHGQLLAIIATLRIDTTTLRSENTRWQHLLTTIQTYNQQQEAREAEARVSLRRSIDATANIVTALPTPAIALPPETPDMVGNGGLTPNALPPSHVPKTSLTPYAQGMPKRWQERERRIRNTEAWQRTRNAIRRQMREREDWDGAGDAARVQESSLQGPGIDA